MSHEHTPCLIKHHQTGRVHLKHINSCLFITAVNNAVREIRTLSNVKVEVFNFHRAARSQSVQLKSILVSFFLHFNKEADQDSSCNDTFII